MKQEQKLVFRIVNKPRKEKKNTEGIAIRQDNRGKASYRRVEIAKWNNWEHSLWVSFFTGETQIVVDSGVIEELAGVIRREKKRQPEKAEARK